MLSSRRRKVVGTGPPPPIFAVFVVLGSAVTLAMLGCVLAGLPNSAAAYITALTIDFFTVAFAFVTAVDVIMQQPMEALERPPPSSVDPTSLRRTFVLIRFHRPLLILLLLRLLALSSLLLLLLRLLL
jgi:hypothetical protein